MLNEVQAVEPNVQDERILTVPLDAAAVGTERRVRRTALEGL